jgi:environmental stress-induced protein Ves
VKIKVVVTVGKKTKTFYGYTDLDEYEAYIPLYQLPVGKYSIKVSVDGNQFKSGTVKKTITIKKADTIVKASKLTAKYKKSKNFTIKVKNKSTLHKVKNLKLKVKVYTGKKAKKYIVKTNKKGIATINTKNLKRGSHKVVITSKNSNYDVYKKLKIVIK